MPKLVKLQHPFKWTDMLAAVANICKLFLLRSFMHRASDQGILVFGYVTLVPLEVLLVLRFVPKKLKFLNIPPPKPLVTLQVRIPASVLDLNKRQSFWLSFFIPFGLFFSYLVFCTCVHFIKLKLTMNIA